MTNLILHSIILLICLSSTVISIISTLDKMESSIAEVLGNTSNAIAFARFAQTYEKKYKSSEEIKHRFGIFCESLEFITSTNKKNLSYTVGINEFADWSWEEFKQRKMGYKAPKDLAKLKSNYTYIHGAFPKTVDWRAEGAISPIKNQLCGDCYAFSAVAALEAAYYLAFKEEIDLSEQQLDDCSQTSGNLGCEGGRMDLAFDYIIKSGGLASEESYPYKGKNYTCLYTGDKAISIRGYTRIEHGSEIALKNAVTYVRPVSVGFTSLLSFRYYTGGIYRQVPDVCKAKPTHALLVIGYGEEYGEPYWIVKNSWGVKWGEEGYARILMGDNLCGIASDATYPIIDIDD